MLRGTFKIIAIFVSGIIALIYLISLLSAFIPPEKSTIIASIGMMIHITVFFTFISAFLWLSFKKWIFSSCFFVLLLIGFPLWHNTIIIPTIENTDDNASQVKIISYNTKMFNFYENFDEIIQFIEEEDADIVCLQEFGHFTNIKKAKYQKSNVLTKFRELYPYSHRWYKNQSYRSESGLATFSKHKIINKEKIAYDSKNNVSILSDVVINHDTIRLINNHLESNKLSAKQRSVMNDISSDNIVSSTKTITETLGKAGNIRTNQARKVRQYVDNSPYPTIVCGDFNDVPQSYVFHTIKGNMNSAFTKAGRWGYYWTYHENMMYFPIDHILIDKKYNIKEATVIKKKHSDHYPISAIFYID